MKLTHKTKPNIIRYFDLFIFFINGMNLDLYASLNTSLIN
jgi:hypothetical protein